VRHVAKEMSNIARRHADWAVICISATLVTMADSSEHRIADAQVNLSQAREAYAALSDEQLAERVYVSFYTG